jgi:putative Holliday junction resolvase
MRALGVDYGEKRIGLALSDPSGTLARPWRTVPRIGNASQVASGLAGIVDALERQDEPVTTIVLGLPKRLTGEATDQTRAVTRVAEHLRRLVTIPVVLQDERLSSREAEARLAAREKDWRKRKALLDAMAAAVILQDYLDSRHQARVELEDDQA